MDVQAELPFFEGIEQALASCVQALGGAKSVGSKLWPDKSVEDARVLLLNCMNPGRKEKLDYTQIMFIFREAKNAGCHAPFVWFAREIGYDTKPVTKAEEVDRLTTVIEQSSKTLTLALNTLDRIQRANTNAPRAV